MGDIITEEIKIGLEMDYYENFEPSITKILNQYGPKMETGLLAVHALLVNGSYINIDYRTNITAAVEAFGAKKLSELYFQTMIKAVMADLGPYKPKRIAHPTLLALRGKQFPEFRDQKALMEEFVALVKERGYALELNTAGLVYPDDCQEVYGEILLPYIKKYQVPVSLGSDAHRPERIGTGFDLPVIQENLKELQPVWEAVY